MATEVKTARLAQVTGIQLAYHAFDQGDPLILLHGGFGSEQREKTEMDEAALRERAAALCDALVAGDIDRATEDFSKELRQNLGTVLALLPLPSHEATVDSVEHGGSGYNVVIRLVGDTEEVLIQTRWKERDGKPTVVEASHLSKTVRAAQGGEDEGEGEGEEIS